MSPDRAPSVQGNTDTGLLKLIALALMCVDHVGLVFFSAHMEWRLIGRLAFPLYAWCVALGAGYTHNIWRYALRLFAWGVVSQVPYMLAFRHAWYQPNILFTLCAGVLGVAGLRLAADALRAMTAEGVTRALRARQALYAVAGLALCAATVFVAYWLKLDYREYGVLLILLLYLLRGSRPLLAAGFLVFCYFWGLPYGRLFSLFGYRLPASGWTTLVVRVQTFAALALPLLLIPMKSGLRVPRWLWYVLYPGHLLIIWLVRLLVG